MNLSIEKENGANRKADGYPYAKKCTPPLKMEFTRLLQDMLESADKESLLDFRISLPLESTLHQKFSAVVLKILKSNASTRNPCLEVLKNFPAPLEQRVWLIFLESACQEWSVGEKFLEEVKPRCYSNNWKYLIPDMGLDAVRRMAQTIMKKSFKPPLTVEGWKDLKHQVACAVLSYGYDSSQILEGTVIQNYLPFASYENNVRNSLAILNESALVECQNIGPKVENIIERAVDALQVPVEFKPLSNDERVSFLMGVEALAMGLCLIYDNENGPQDVMAPLDPALPLNTITLLHAIVGGYSLAALIHDDELATRFAAFYLMDGRDHILMDNFSDGLGTCKSWNIFKNLLKSAANIGNVNVENFLTLGELGHLHHLAVDVREVHDRLLSRKSNFLLNGIFRKIQDWQVERVIRESEDEPIPLALGWCSLNQGGHAVCGIIHKGAVEILNTGIGIENHLSIPSQDGINMNYSTTAYMPKMGVEKLKTYLFNVISLNNLDSAMDLAASKSLPLAGEYLEGLALFQHYGYLTEKTGREQYAKPQQSITCSVKVLKKLVRHSTSFQPKEFHLIGRALVYAAWHTKFEQLQLSSVVREELKQTFAKAAFRLLNTTTPTGALSNLVMHFRKHDLDHVEMVNCAFRRALEDKRSETCMVWLLEALLDQRPVAAQHLADVFEASIALQISFKFATDALIESILLVDEDAAFFKNVYLRSPNILKFDWPEFAKLQPFLFQRLKSLVSKSSTCKPFTEHLNSIVF